MRWCGLTINEFLASFPIGGSILFIVYSIMLIIYFFIVTAKTVEEDEVPWFLFSKEGYDVIMCPLWICIIIWELFMLPAQLFLLCVYAVVQWTCSIKERKLKTEK